MSDFKTKLFLITPRVAEAGDLPQRLEAALEAGEVACVLIRHAARDERAAKALVRVLVPVIQKHGAAVLVEADPRLAAHADADGVQVRGVGDDLDSAIERMKPDRIVGCGGLDLRDDAMTAGEGDIDYVMFGEPAPDGTLPSPEATLERVQWWAEIFNVPCVGFAQTLADVEPLAAAGAEFVAVSKAVFDDPRGIAAAVGDVMASLKQARQDRAARAAASN
jgi:thiamine-phosphate pyrophosphorylase